jgi:hypothetical protein
VSPGKTMLDKAHPSTSSTSQIQTLSECSIFSPQRRPCYPQLIVLDDQSLDLGECLRIRDLQVSIGRDRCDLTFPAESMMSAHHATLALTEIADQTWSWVLNDHQSANGLYIRIDEFGLTPGLEFLLGGSKIVVEGPRKHLPAASDTLASGIFPYRSATKVEKKATGLRRVPYALSPASEIIPLTGRSLEIGSSVNGPGRIEHDPFVEAIHAKVILHGSSHWKIVDQKSTNGIWLRITKAIMQTPCEFLAGEQRFRFLPPVDD